MFKGLNAELIKIVEERFEKRGRQISTAMLVAWCSALMIGCLIVIIGGVVTIVFALKAIYSMAIVPIAGFIRSIASGESGEFLAVVVVGMAIFGVAVVAAAHVFDRIGKFIERSKTAPK